MLAPYLSSRGLANFAGFLLVFCGVLLAGHLVSYVVGKFLKVTGLSIFDHLLGAVFGALRGLLISVALIMAIMAFSQGHGSLYGGRRARVRGHGSARAEGGLSENV